MASELTKEFWTKVKHELSMQLPFHLKFIMNTQLVPENPIILALFTKEEFAEIEDFIRSDTYGNEIPSGADLEKYYGTNSSNDFRFSEVDKKLLNKDSRFN